MFHDPGYDGNHILPEFNYSMMEKDENKKLPGRKSGTTGKNDMKGYLPYPASEDIYSKYQEEKNINPEDISRMKDPVENGKDGKNNEKDFIEDSSGSDLDVPGSELDDDQENVGSEDEENNFYSIGGEDHENLDEDKGE